MTKTTAAILTILTDAAAQVDRARPADARNGPGWDGPGAEWWEDFTETVEQQLDAGDVAADATAKEQRDVVERLDDDDLETIVACIKNGQPGRVTPYEIKAMCEELIHLRASQAGRVPAGALSLRDLKREIANTKNDLNGLALIGCVPLWSSLTSRLDELYERLSASPPPPATDGTLGQVNNAALLDLSKVWQLDGDWMTCRSCNRSLIASRDGEPFIHRADCQNSAHLHPWPELRNALASSPPPVTEIVAPHLIIAEAVHLNATREYMKPWLDAAALGADASTDEVENG